MKIKTKTLKPSELAAIQMTQEVKEAKGQELSGTKVTDDNILNQVLESFGGEIVEE